MSFSTRRQQQERDNNEYSNTQQHHQASIRSIDQTKEEMRRAIEELKRETPRYSQTITDFQNETADASMEIADNFLESQKEVINSMQSAWDPVAERTRGGGAGGHNWTTIGMMDTVPFFSPSEMANIYARTIGAMTEAYLASTRMATNMLFAGIDATRATTNYARQNAKEASRITSNTARAFAQTAKETVQVQGEDEERGGSEAGSFGSRGGAATTTTAGTFATEGTVAASSSDRGSTTTAETGGARESTAGSAEKIRKK
jgi:hypothetical protein